MKTRNVLAALSLILLASCEPKISTPFFELYSKLSVVNGVGRFVSGVCARVHTCFKNSDLNECHIAMMNSAEFANELGLREDYGTTEKIADDVEAKALDVNAELVKTCLPEIQGLACDVVQTGYDPRDPHNFGNLENFLKKAGESGEVMICPFVSEKIP